MGGTQPVESRELGLRTGSNDDSAFLKSPWLLFAVICGVIVSFGLIVATASNFGHDFRVFWQASRATNVYTADPFGPFVYPPTALVWIKPLALLPFWPAFALWSVMSLAAFMTVARKWLLLLSPVVVQCLVYGQTSLLIGALILYAANRPSWARGALLGLALTLKPQVVFLAPLVLFARKDWDALCGLVGGVALSVAVSVALFGFRPWSDWIAALPLFGDDLAARNLWWVTITPYGTAMRFGLNPYPFWIAGVVLALVAAWRSRTDLAATIVLTSILASPYAMVNDLAAALPFALTSMGMAGALIYSAALAPLALAVFAFDQGFRLRRRGFS